MNRKNRKRRNFRLKIIAIVGVLISVLLIALGLKTFSVQKVETQDYLACMGDFKPKQLEKLTGQNLFLINKNNIEKSLQNQFYCLKQVNLSKIFPNKIKVSFTERLPKIVLISIDSEATGSAGFLGLVMNDASSSASVTPQILQKKGAFLADEEGVIFSISNGENLPRIYSWSDLNIGHKIDKDLIDKILKAINKLNLLNMATTDSLINPDNTYLMYSNPPVYFNLSADLDFQIASLQLILKTAKINTDVKFVDLRFNKPIIRYAPKKT